jgi:UDP-3-O-[3-hydroxymyristoyl] N-acetylglucosamine deacetylase
MRQRTIKREVVIEGVGLDSGKVSKIRLVPSGPNTGISFLNSNGVISADLSCLGDDDSTTSLGLGNAKVKTVEHLLSCLYGLYIDNLKVELLVGNEIPIGDGSAKIFYDAISEVGIHEIKDSVRVMLCITEPINIRGKNKSIKLTPSKNFIIDYLIDWHPAIKNQYTFRHTLDNYKEIAFAKTFAESSHIKNLQMKNRAKGVVVGENCIDIDSEIASNSTEFVKHKILDLLGDLSLLYGLHFQGKITAINAGHKLHHELVKRILP